MTELLVPRRFCGPPDSGNGGWTAGALAAILASEDDAAAQARPVVEVSLRQPPPLDTVLAVAVGADTATATLGEAVVATARRAPEVTLVEVAAVGPAVARAAEAAYPGHSFHPFPTCFVCGTARAEGDGLRIFPGRLPEAGEAAGAVGARVAATWTPNPGVGGGEGAAQPRASVAATWAALDCVGGWAGDLAERLMVLGRMTTRIDTLPTIGAEHVVVGSGRRREGRKTYTAATLYDVEGRVVATAEHIWIAVDPTLFGGVRPPD